MPLKITKAIWFFSLIVFLAVFFYNYAALGESLTIFESEPPVIVSREGVFYIFIAIAATTNLFVFLVNKFFSSHDFKIWFYGLIATLNIFLTIAINYLALYNSNERFDYSRIGGIIYGSLILIIVWLLAWPVYSLSRKFFFK